MRSVRIDRRRPWRLEDLNETMQADNNMSYADRLDDLDHDRAADNISWSIFLVRIVGLYKELGDSPAIIREW